LETSGVGTAKASASNSAGAGGLLVDTVHTVYPPPPDAIGFGSSNGLPNGSVESGVPNGFSDARNMSNDSSFQTPPVSPSPLRAGGGAAGEGEVVG
jgi:hypothetical protein